MKQLFTTGILMAALTISAAAQDWYHQREDRFHGDEWKSHIFMQVRTDLEHVWSGHAAEREHDRLVKTEQELTKMQADLDRGRWDNGILNDVIDSVPEIVQRRAAGIARPRGPGGRFDSTEGFSGPP